MPKLRPPLSIPGCALTVLLCLALCGCAGRSATAPQDTDPNAAYEAFVEAYIYGYPLVSMEMTRRVMTNVAEPGPQRAPMGGFANMRQYPDAAFRDFTTPNADTLYSFAWLDLSREPYVLSMPDMGGRYHLMPMLSGWTEVFASPGTRTTGNAAKAFAITGPGFTGVLPAGLTQIKAPTNMVWILGRTYCDGTPEDYAAVRALQDRYALVPLSAYGRPHTPQRGAVDPGIDMKTAVREQVNAMRAEDFFTLLGRLMAANPPAGNDAPMLAKLARLGIGPGSESGSGAFDTGRLDPALREKLATLPQDAYRRILAYGNRGDALVNGWLVRTNLGRFGTDYMLRAMTTALGIGANLAEDAVYPTYVGAGQKLQGANDYVLRFEKGQLPPVDGFWSLTMYTKQYYFVDNPLKRYTISQRDRLITNADGSVDIYLQKDSPGKDKEANWLPAPEGQMNPVLRLYWPKTAPPSVLDGSWSPPAVVRVR